MGYRVFEGSDREYELREPTNAALRDVWRLFVRAMHKPLETKVQICEQYGWDPAEAIPGYSREDRIVQAADALDIDSNLLGRTLDEAEIDVDAPETDLAAEPVYLFEWPGHVAEIIFLGVEVDFQDEDAENYVGRVSRAAVEEATANFLYAAESTKYTQRLISQSSSAYLGLALQAMASQNGANTAKS